MSRGFVTSKAVDLSSEGWVIAALERVPDDSTLLHLRVGLSAVAGVARVDWYLAADAAGDEPVSPLFSTPIVPGATTPGRGAAIQPIGLAYCRCSALSPARVNSTRPTMSVSGCPKPR